MKISEIRKLENTVIREKLREAQEKILKLRFSVQSGQAKKVRELRVLSKSIARMLTALKENDTSTK